MAMYMLKESMKGNGLQLRVCHSPTQEFGGTLIGEDGLLVMAGAESVECYQICQTWFPWFPCV